MECRSTAAALLLIFLLLCLPPSQAHSTILAQSKTGAHITCDLCLSTLYLVQKLAELKTPQDDVLQVVADICSDAGIYTQQVCNGLVVNTFGPIVYDLLLSSQFSPTQICTGFGLCNASDSLSAHMPRLPPMSPLAARRAPRSHRRRVDWPAAGESNWRPSDPNIGYVLHFSDVHYDDEYVIGGIADCSEPLCCRNISENGTERAGKWGDYHCDLSSAMLEAWFDAITSLPFPLDFIMWTGDTPPHDVWEESRTTQVFRSEFLVDRLKAAFPETIIYPALGNHESYPSDQYHLPEWQWLNDNMSQFWSSWISPASQATVRQGGYYSELIQPGFRIISLNTQYGDLINFYWILGNLDYGNMTEWFIGELTAAEAAGEKVWIISHIPMMVQAQVLDVWSGAYAQIVARFSDIILGIFCGHTHNDQFITILDAESAPVNAQFIIPAVTTYTWVNPSFRVWAYDRTTFEVLDYQQWNTNLTLANAIDNATFAPWYSALEYFSLDNLSGPAMQDLFTRMTANETLAQLYLTAYNSQVLTDSCTGQCLRELLCDTQGTTAERSAACFLELSR